MGAKLTAGIDLLLDDASLFDGEKARARLPVHRMREAIVRAVTSLGVLCASATGFAALDGSLGQGAAAHRFGIG
jgi:hypothetical protein